MSSMVDKLQPIIEPIVEKNGCELIEMEYVNEDGQWYLRIFADKPGRIDINDCALISEEVSITLDALDPDPFPQAYFLEVSSPGAERPLKDDEAIEKAVGEYVHFAYHGHVEGETFHEGTLIESQPDAYILEIRDKALVKQITVPKDAIRFARLAVQF